MTKGTDWIQLWRELVKAQPPSSEEGEKTKRYHRATNRRWAKPDSTQGFIMSQLDRTPEATVLDIGAGKGSWAVLLSPHACRVTAIDSSSEMVREMRANISAAGITNVDIIQGSWPGISVEPHDYALCSHGMYGSADLPAFVRHMEQSTRRTCFLILRAATLDGVMAEAAMRIWGHPYDSPNFQVCYNALCQMGIFANVLMADCGLWSPWKNSTLEEALAETKRRFGISGACEHDDFLMDLLRRRLVLEDGQYVWPRSVRSALIYWDQNSKHDRKTQLSIEEKMKCVAWQ